MIRWFVLLVLPVLTFCKGTGERDAQLRQLYVGGSAYLSDTRLELEQAKTAEKAAIVIENSLPRLEKLVKKKKLLEKQYPELADTGREKIHAQFPEFLRLRSDLKNFMDYGATLLEKYKSNDRFATAVRRGMTLMNYF